MTPIVNAETRCPFVWKDERSNLIVCPVCGTAKTLKSKRKRRPEKVMRYCTVRARTREIGWGDKTERALKRIGITKTRWVRWKIWWRRSRKQTLGCQQCDKRQEKINQYGWRWRYWLARKTWPVKWAVCRVWCWMMPKPVAASPKRRRIPMRIRKR